MCILSQILCIIWLIGITYFSLHSIPLNKHYAFILKWSSMAHPCTKRETFNNNPQIIQRHTDFKEMEIQNLKLSI